MRRCDHNAALNTCVELFFTLPPFPFSPIFLHQPVRVCPNCMIHEMKLQVIAFLLISPYSASPYPLPAFALSNQHFVCTFTRRFCQPRGFSVMSDAKRDDVGAKSPPHGQRADISITKESSARFCHEIEGQLPIVCRLDDAF